MNARNAPWIVALVGVAALASGCAFGLVWGVRRAPRACAVTCTSSLHVEATGPATYTLSCGGDR